MNNLKQKIVEPLFNGSIFTHKYNWLEAVKLYLIDSLYKKSLILVNQAVINDKIFQIYSLSPSDKELVTEKQGDDVANLPLTKQAKEFFILYDESLLNDFVKEKILQVPECDTYVSEKLQSAIFQVLKGSDLENICNKHLIHPLDVLFGVQHLEPSHCSKGIAQEMAFEFLTDIIRQILLDDEDGIIPMVPNAGEKVLLDRIEEKFREKGFSSAQYSSFDSILGRSIHEYLNNYFFAELSDHLNLFSYLPKTPFIWHLYSGPEQGFDCYIIIYKWSRDKLLRLKSVYIENRERALVNRQSDLANNDSAEAQNEKNRIGRQLKEIESFKAKIDDLLSEGYDPILDDGVGKNIAPLQKRNMIPYDVLNPGQLKKYLNADW